MSQSKYQGAIQVSTRQGAIQTQAQAYVGNLSDTVAVTDVPFPVRANLNGSSHIFYRNDADFPESKITGDLTIQGWFKPDGTALASQEMTLVCKYDPSAKRMWGLFLTKGAYVMYFTSDDGNNYKADATTGANSITTDAWNHIALTFDVSSGTAEVYINGEWVEQVIGLDTTISSETAAFIIGAFGSASSNWWKYKGEVANVALFDDIRTPSEVMLSYQDYDIDLSGEGNIIGQWMFDEAAGATYIDNTQGDAGRDLIPYNGGNTTFGNAGRDDSEVTLSATVALAGDTVSMADELSGESEKGLSDTVSMADELSGESEKGLSDTVSMADAKALDAVIEVGDYLYTHEFLETLTHTEIELLTHLELETTKDSDKVYFTDDLTFLTEPTLQDAVSLADEIVQKDAVTHLQDAVSLADEIVQKDAVTHLQDTVIFTDVLTGSMGGIVDPVGVVAAENILPPIRRHVQLRRAVTNSATPLTAITTSSQNTTFTKTSMTDTMAWDISSVEAGDQIATQDGYVAAITSIVGTTININGWVKDGYNRDGRAADKPSDGSQVTAYRRVLAWSVEIVADPGNTETVYIGFDNAVSPLTGHPLTPNPGNENSKLNIKATGPRPLNLSNIWVVSYSTQAIYWQTSSR